MKHNIQRYPHEIRLLHEVLVEEFDSHICTCDGYFYHVRSDIHRLEVGVSHDHDYLLVVQHDSDPVPPHKVMALASAALYKPNFPFTPIRLSWGDPGFFEKIKTHLRKYVRREHDRT